LEKQEAREDWRALVKEDEDLRRCWALKHHPMWSNAAPNEQHALGMLGEKKQGSLSKQAGASFYTVTKLALHPTTKCCQSLKSTS